MSNTRIPNKIDISQSSLSQKCCTSKQAGHHKCNYPSKECNANAYRATNISDGASTSRKRF